MGQVHPAIQKNIDAFDQGLAAAGIDDYYSAGAERFRACLENLAVPPNFCPLFIVLKIAPFPVQLGSFQSVSIDPMTSKTCLPWYGVTVAASLSVH